MLTDQNLWAPPPHGGVGEAKGMFFPNSLCEWWRRVKHKKKEKKSGVKWFWLRRGVWLNVSFNLGCGFVADSRQTNRNWQSHTLGDFNDF